MNTTTISERQIGAVITPSELIEHWQGHRRLTRQIIEAFPEKELFDYSIGGMRPFAAIVRELLSIAGPGMRQIVGGDAEELNENVADTNSKANLLSLWDQSSEEIKRQWAQITPEKFHENILLFGKYHGTVWFSIFYMIDNEIHRRGQGYVYLRSLGVEPHPFYDR